MSYCTCDKTEVRVSDEGIWPPTESTNLVSEGVRLRCLNCQGKAGFIELSALEALGVSEERAREIAEPGDRTSVQITVKPYKTR